MQENDSSALKIAAAVTGVILVCFSIGYFVLGPSARTQDGGGQQLATSGGQGAGATIVERSTGPSPRAAIEIVDRTAQIEEKKKEEEEKRKKQEEEEKKKREEEEKKKQEEEEAALAAANPSPSPDPDDLPPLSPTPTPSPVDVDPGEPGEPNIVAPTPRPFTPEPGEPAPRLRPADIPVPQPRATPTPPAPAPTPMGPTASADSNVTTPASLYRVRIGAFADRANADRIVAELKEKGFSASVSTLQRGGKTLYRLQAGAYKEEKNARQLASALQDNGFSATVSRDN